MTEPWLIRPSPEPQPRSRGSSRAARGEPGRRGGSATVGGSRVRRPVPGAACIIRTRPPPIRYSFGMRLPIDDALPDLLAVLRARPSAVLQAPPGAGKTTRVPLAVLDEPWLAGGRVLM